MKRIYEYCKWVHQNNKFDNPKNPDLCNWYELKKVERFEADIAKSKSDPTYPYYFDEGRAQNIINLAEEFKLVDGEFEGKPMKVLPFQAFDFVGLLSWRKKKNGYRRYKTGNIFGAKGIGKSPWAAILSIYDAKKEPGSQTFSIANSREQAAITFSYVKRFVESHPVLSEEFRFMGGKDRKDIGIALHEDGSIILALSSNSENKHGKNVSMLIADEISSYKDSSLFMTMKSMMNKRTEPLLVMITHGSTIIDGPYYTEWEYAKKILNGEIEDDEYFASLYQLDDGDDWTDQTIARKCNPGLGVIVKEESYATSLKEALRDGKYAVFHKTTMLNMWLSGSNSWIDDHTWTLSSKDKGDVTEEELLEAPVCGGLDLATVNDFAAYTLCFYLKRRNLFYQRHLFYIPENELVTKEKYDSDSIVVWKEKYIKTTEGETINPIEIFEDIDADILKYPNFCKLAFDRLHKGDLVSNYFKDNSKLTVVPTNWKPTVYTQWASDWQRDIKERRVLDTNPVMRWMVGNGKISIKNDIIRIEKDKASKRIDGIVSSILAHSILKNTEDIEVEISGDEVLEILASFRHEVK